MYRDRRKSFGTFSSEIETLSDEQAKEMIEQHIAFQKKGVQLEIQFYAIIKEILPPKKIMKLYITEMQFREHMLKHIRGERGYSRGKRTE